MPKVLVLKAGFTISPFIALFLFVLLRIEYAILRIQEAFRDRHVCETTLGGACVPRVRGTAMRGNGAKMWRFSKSSDITEGIHTGMEVMARRAYDFRNFGDYRMRRQESKSHCKSLIYKGYYFLIFRLCQQKYQQIFLTGTERCHSSARVTTP